VLPFSRSFLSLTFADRSKETLQSIDTIDTIHTIDTTFTHHTP